MLEDKLAKFSAERPLNPFHDLSPAIQPEFGENCIRSGSHCLLHSRSNVCEHARREWPLRTMIGVFRAKPLSQVFVPGILTVFTTNVGRKFSSLQEWITGFFIRTTLFYDPKIPPSLTFYKTCAASSQPPFGSAVWCLTSSASRGNEVDGRA